MGSVGPEAHAIEREKEQVMVRTTLVAAICVLSAAALLAQSDSQSSDAARELARALDAHHLDAVAAPDPQGTNRFIAALYIAPSQLLVVSAPSAAAEAVALEVRQGKYRDVYLDLQSSPENEGKLFVHDMDADGLNRTGKATRDNVYESGRLIDLTKGKGAEQFGKADAEYARMLRVLIAAVSASPGSTSTANGQITSK
jgi:hypothetical protein